MRPVRSACAASILLLACGLAACGTSDAAEQSPEAGAAGRAATVTRAGSGDGGRLCEALASWQQAIDDRPPVGNDLVATLETLRYSQTTFVSEVRPAVPPRLAAEADGYIAGRALAIEELAELDPAVVAGATSLQSLFEAGHLPVFAAFAGRSKPAPDPTATDPAAPDLYVDELMAWVADPCGPKPLGTTATIAWAGRNI